MAFTVVRSPLFVLLLDGIDTPLPVLALEENRLGALVSFRVGR